LRLIDTHAHLDFEDYDSDRFEVLKRAAAAGVEKIVNVGADLAGSQRSVKLAQQYNELYAVVGIHPHAADTVNSDVLANLTQLAEQSVVKGIGEIGLDFYYDNSPREIQQVAFKKQLQLAQKIDLPVIIHSREAAEETLALLSEVGDFKEKLIFHCYSYGPDYIEELIKRDYYIAFGGMLTFKNAESVRQALKKVPLNRLLLETDSPYLTPVPYRGQRNEPAYVKQVAEQAAQLKELPLAELADLTTANAKRIYKL
jgi:TatD DNase family protein